MSFICSTQSYITTSVQVTIAGTGEYGSSGDGDAATSAQLNNPWGIAVDISGNVFVADAFNSKIRRVSSTGIITTFAGTGDGGSSGDGGAATSAQLNYPYGIALNTRSGNLYIADYWNQKIRLVTSAGIITTIAGSGTDATFYWPTGIAVDAVLDNLYITDGNNIIRMVTSAGIITTFAGTSDYSEGVSGDGGAATSTILNYPVAVAWDNISGSLYIVDGNNAIRLVTSDGIITTFAGTGTWGSTGDGGPATSAQLNGPQGIAVDAQGS